MAEPRTVTAGGGPQGRTPAQIYSLAFGAVLLLAGVLGFFVSSDFEVGTDVRGDDLILFEVNVGLVIGLVVFVGLVGWRIGAIVGAENPVMRAVQLIALTLPLLSVVFAFTYLSVSHADPAGFSDHLSRVDALYFTVSIISTVGFGDIAAELGAARILATIQMAFDLALIALLLRFLVLATRAGLERRGH
jgi:hypothetical protein